MEQTTVKRTKSGLLGLAAAAMVALAAIGAPPAQAADEIGAVSDLYLIAYGTPPQSARAPIFHRDGIVLNEELETVQDAALRVVFIDETVLDMGGGGKLLVDDMVYDPASGKGRSLVNLLQGSFFYVSGKLPHDSIRLETPTAIIGVRGTEVSIDIDPDGRTVLSVIDGEVQFTSKATGESETVSEGSNVEISATGVLSPVRFGMIRPRSVFIRKVSTLSARRKFQALTSRIRLIESSGEDVPPELLRMVKEMATVAAEVVNTPGNYGSGAQLQARAILSSLPGKVNIAQFVRSVGRQDRVEQKFRLNREKKVVLANFEYRRLPDGTIQRREIGEDQASPSSLAARAKETRRRRLRERLTALIGAGASVKVLKKRVIRNQQVNKCRKRPRLCRRLLGL